MRRGSGWCAAHRSGPLLELASQIVCHDRMKHVQRRHFFVRDMVESFELEVPFVRTADNLADMFTKAMKNANDFHRLRRIVMNEQ